MCCPGNEDLLSMDTVLYQGFGGYHVEKNGEIYYWADSDLDWEKYKTLSEIERVAKRTPSDEWKVVLNNPLRGATWIRKRGQWHLIETNMGFA